MIPVEFAIREYIRQNGITDYEIVPKIWDAIDWINEVIPAQGTPKTLKLNENIAFFYQFRCSYIPFTDTSYNKKSRIYLKSEHQLTPVNPIILVNDSETLMKQTVGCEFIAVHAHEVTLFESLTAPGAFSWLNNIRYGYFNYFLLKIKS